MSKLNDIDRDFSDVFDHTPFYGGCAKSFRYTDLRLAGIIKAQQQTKRDRTESWNLFVTLSVWLVPRLKDLVAGTQGHPVDMDSMEEWYDVLNRMIAGFSLIAEDEFTTETEEAVSLLGKYFFELWD